MSPQKSQTIHASNPHKNLQRPGLQGNDLLKNNGLGCKSTKHTKQCTPACAMATFHCARHSGDRARTQGTHNAQRTTADPQHQPQALASCDTGAGKASIRLALPPVVKPTLVADHPTQPNYETTTTTNLHAKPNLLASTRSMARKANKSCKTWHSFALAASKPLTTTQGLALHRHVKQRGPNSEPASKRINPEEHWQRYGGRLPHRRTVPCSACFP